MIVLGLLLILIAVGATLFVVMATVQVIAPPATFPIKLTAVGVTFSASPLAMFIAGAVSLVLLAVGYALISRGTRRRARSRKELRQLRKEQAVAGTSPSAEGGHRSSRRDRHQVDDPTSATTEDGSDTGTSSDVGSDTGTRSDVGSDTEAEASPSRGPSVPSDRHQGSEPPSAT